MLSLVETVDPIQPHIGAIRRNLRNVRMFRINQLIKQFKIKMDLPTVVFVDGVPILREKWDEILSGFNVIFYRLPRGPLAPALAAIGAYFTTTAGLITLGVGALAIGALVTGLLLAPQVDSDNFSTPSPTYSITAQGNYARIGNPIPILYGKHLVFCDYVVQPYRANEADTTDYADDQQFFYALLHVTYGTCDFAAGDIRVDDTPIDNFPEVTWSKIEPGGAMPGWFNPGIITAIEVENINLEGGNAVAGQYKGPFAVNPPRTVISEIMVDIEHPLGLYDVDTPSNTISVEVEWEARRINDDGTVYDVSPGVPSAWTKIIDQTVSNDFPIPLRKTHSSTTLYPGGLPDGQGRYEIRCRRITPAWRADKVDETVWTGLKGKIVGWPTTFAGITCLAVKIQASESLNSRTVRRINVVATRKLPSWTTGGGWAAAAVTQNPAWAIADILRNTDYGQGIADAYIDLPALEDLAATWDSRGDRFNGVFDSKLTAWEALSRVARVGRAAPVIQAGCVRIIRDVKQTIPSMIFTPRNIKSGSLNINYLVPHEETPDGVMVKFTDERDWKDSEVSVDEVGGTPNNPAEIQLFGITDVNQATREALYLARNNRYRRKQITLETEMEGFIPQFGDLVYVQHDCPAWGESSGEIKGLQGTSLLISELFAYDPGKDYVVWFQKLDGSISGPHDLVGDVNNNLELAGTISYVDNGQTIALTGDITLTIHYNSEYERTKYSIGIKSTQMQPAIIKEVSPRGIHAVQIRMINENDLVHGIIDEAAGTIDALTNLGASLTPAQSDAIGEFLYQANQKGYWGKLKWFCLPVFNADAPNWMNWKTPAQVATWAVSAGTFDRVNHPGRVHLPSAGNSLYLAPGLGSASAFGVGSLAGIAGAVVSEISATGVTGVAAGHMTGTSARWQLRHNGTEWYYSHNDFNTAQGAVKGSTDDLGFICGDAHATDGLGNNRAIYHYDKAIFDVEGTIETKETDGGTGVWGTVPSTNNIRFLCENDAGVDKNFFKGDIHALFLGIVNTWTAQNAQDLAFDLYTLIPEFFEGAENLP